ncbi:hypothetical protein [Actinoplanes friuliensis]|jgi:hypothetical protein|nr:hypothetical protein [Actinoplanes friuliensis]
MDLAMNALNSVIADLFGPDSPVPWWAWAATAIMIFGGLLAPMYRDE